MAAISSSLSHRFGPECLTWRLNLHIDVQSIAEGLTLGRLPPTVT